MVTRKRSIINRFLNTLLVRVLKLVFLLLILVAASYLRIVLTRESRAATLTLPENPQPPPPPPRIPCGC